MGSKNFSGNSSPDNKLLNFMKTAPLIETLKDKNNLKTKFGGQVPSTDYDNRILFRTRQTRELVLLQMKIKSERKF